MPRVTGVVAANLRQTRYRETQILRASATLASRAPAGWGALRRSWHSATMVGGCFHVKALKSARGSEERSEESARPLLARLLLLADLKGGDDKWHSSEGAETRLLG